VGSSETSVLVCTFENLLNSNALNMWWKENFRVTRETFHFIFTVVPVIQRQDHTSSSQMKRALIGNDL